MWISALVMTDVGDDISQGPPGPWLTHEDRYSTPLPSWTTLLPTIQHRSNIALRVDSLDTDNKPSLSRSFPQSAALLAENYGALLNHELMSLDPFYALSDLFSFCAYAEAQCLNLLDSVISSDTNYSSLYYEAPTLSNLLCCQEILDTHLSQIRTNIELLKSRGGGGWPCVPQNHQLHGEAIQTAKTLQKDFEDLAARAELSSRRCTRGMKIMMNNVMLAESKRALSLTQKATRLTLIAFFYIPLSFTTSFFGMNLNPIQSGLPIWVWFATTIPVLIFSICFLYYDAKMHQRQWERFKDFLGVCRVSAFRR